MSDKPGPSSDLAARARWQRWEMESLDALRANPMRRETDRNAERRKAELRRRATEALTQAREQGQARGYQEGFEQGRQAGRTEGLELGRAEGLEQGRTEGRTAGYQDGMAQGHADGAALAREQAKRLDTLANACGAALNGLEAEVGQALIQLATGIAEQVLRSHLRDHPNQILELVQDVLQSAPRQGTAIFLRLHPDDLALVQAFLQQNPDLSQYQLVADEQITRGGCIAETLQGSIDATLETRWLRVTAALGKAPGSP
jgi:flagellar assembly protein FliH